MQKIVFVYLVSIVILAGCDDGAVEETDVQVDTSDIADLEIDADDDAFDLVEEPDTGLPVVLPPGTDDDFASLCEMDWNTELSSTRIDELKGEFVGVFNSLPTGTLQLMKLTPEHPYHATSIRVAFHGDSGPIRVRLMRTIGQSYPDFYSADADMLPPIEMDLESPHGSDWLDIDITEHDVFLYPTVPYVLATEQLAGGPFLAVEDVPEGEENRALVIESLEDVPWGIADGQFRMELDGDYFCTWDAEDMWFEEDTDAPFHEERSERVSFADLNGDGHDDVIINPSAPKLYFGDGAGGFTLADFEPFADEPLASLVLFGDVDNDGDSDAFAAYNVSIDGDGDRVSIEDGDCDDRVDTTNPDQDEILDNGVDDDCDGIADDGTNTDDADEDGMTIADGDCNDNVKTIYLGAPEVLDSRDNDCNGLADEIFYNAILLNDGTGQFSKVETSGVEALDNTAVAGFGDGDGDGDLDLYWGNWLVTYPYPTARHDVYAVGDGDGTFDQSTGAAGLVPPRGAEPAYGVSWNDYNNDGHQDIWVGNYGGSIDLLFQNQGNGSFIEVGGLAGISRDPGDVLGGTTFGGDWGDIDNDGDMDLFSAHICHPRDYTPTSGSDPSALFINQGPPDYTFVNMRDEYGISWSEGDVNASFADFDNDMDLDLFIATLYEGHFSRLYRNDGEAGFTDVSYQTMTNVEDAVSPAWSDVDGDGDLDLAVASRSGTDRVQLFINNIVQENNWIELRLEGTTTNRDAIGARVILTAGGVTQMRDVRAGSGHNVQQSFVVHFGLAQNETIERATVRWVGGDIETITGLEPNGRYAVVEGSGEGVVIP